MLSLFRLLTTRRLVRVVKAVVHPVTPLDSRNLNSVLTPAVSSSQGCQMKKGKSEKPYLRSRQSRRDVSDECDIEGRKEMFYLMTHSNHFILRLYGVGHMVKDHSDSERGNPLPPHGLLFPISSKGSFICTIPQTG